jgi:hypothetical protein
MRPAFSSFPSQVAGYSYHRFACQRSVAMFAGLLTTRLATGRVNPPHTHQQNIINDTSQRPNILPETQPSTNHHNLQFQRCYFMFYLPNKRRRCHLDVARCGRKVYQIYFWRHQPPAFVTTISKNQLLFENQEISDFHNRLVLAFSFF